MNKFNLLNSYIDFITRRLHLELSTAILFKLYVGFKIISLESSLESHGFCLLLINLIYLYLAYFKKLIYLNSVCIEKKFKFKSEVKIKFMNNLNVIEFFSFIINKFPSKQFKNYAIYFYIYLFY